MFVVQLQIVTLMHAQSHMHTLIRQGTVSRDEDIGGNLYSIAYFYYSFMKGMCHEIFALFIRVGHPFFS